jgi:hypothetical protein
MRIRKLSSILGIAALCLCGGNIFAQDNNGGGPPDFDPAQFRQRMMEQTRKNLDVTNNDEWAVIQPLVEKVMEARREAFSGGGMGMGFGGPPPGGPGGPPPGGGPPPDGDQGGPGGRRGFGPPRSAEHQALQKVLDDKAPTSEVKSALAKFRASRADKQARLAAAQSNLQAVLTLRQEAAAVLMGLLQ